MMYVRDEDRSKLSSDVREFIRGAVRGGGQWPVRQRSSQVQSPSG
jgi:hypothetical protein